MLVVQVAVVRAKCWQANIIEVAVTMISWIVVFMLEIAKEVDSGRV